MREEPTARKTKRPLLLRRTAGEGTPLLLV